MRSILTGKALALGLLAGITGAVAVLAACSSNSSPGGSGNNGNGNGNGNGEGGTTTQSGTCSNPSLNILFSPMYSAYIPNSQHTFQIPAVVNGIDNSTVQWSASDTSMVSLAPDPDTGGTMITVNGSGMVQIVATAGGLCGVSTLNITAAQESDWDMGNARYNNGVPFNPACIYGNDSGTYTNPRDGGVFPCPDAGPACTNCHGPTANSGRGFDDVAHTPEQTGGFSDDDLVNIFTNGTVPDGGYFDPSIISYNFWQQFHTWTDIQGPMQKAMVVYLRSLTPAPQEGGANFGGHYDGGHHHDGGFPGMDSGSGGGNDSGAPDDSGTKAD